MRDDDLGQSQPIVNSLDLLAVGETLVDFISIETSDSLEGATTFRRYQGGSPANIAVYVSKLGGRAAVVSKVGAGAFGKFLKHELQAHGVSTEYLIEDPHVHTSIVFVSHTAGTPDFEPWRSGDSQLTPEDVPEQAVARARVVHTSTFALSRQPCRSAVGKALRLAHEMGKIVSLDPNYSPKIWPDYAEAISVVREMYRFATITKPSLDDARRLFGSGPSPEAYIQMFHEMGPDLVVLTMGKDGILVSQAGQKPAHVPTHPVKVVDATGAGDSFWAGFLVALLDGNPPERCALFAREIVEQKLQTVGPLPDALDRAQIYARLPASG
jgi:fructokinase